MNIERIKNYIIRKYPRSCLSYNYKRNSYNNEQLMKACEDFFYYEKLNWCGCGDPDTAKKVIRNYLDVISSKFDKPKPNIDFKNNFGVDTIYDNDLLLCLAYTIDSAGFTEHGSAIDGAWITDEGKMFLWLLKYNQELDEE